MKGRWKINKLPRKGRTTNPRDQVFETSGDADELTDDARVRAGRKSRSGGRELTSAEQGGESGQIKGMPTASETIESEYQIRVCGGGRPRAVSTIRRGRKLTGMKSVSKMEGQGRQVDPKGDANEGSAMGRHGPEDETVCR